MDKLRYITKEYLQQFLPENPVIVEAGGHIGRDAIQMAKTWPLGQIHTFEPVPHLYAQLVENTQPYPNISTYNIALSDTTGLDQMNISSAECDAVSSMLAPKQFLEKRPDVSFMSQTVPTIRLDDWAQQHNIDHVDLMWLDLQGYELVALQAAEHLLKTVKVIHTEVSIVERYASNPLYDEVKAWLEARGFVLQAESMYRVTWGNALFIRK